MRMTFSGSGADDGFLALRFSGQHLSCLPLSWHGQVGYLRAGDSDLLEDVQEQDLWFAGLALDWALAETLVLDCAAGQQCRALDSDITAVGGAGYLLTLGRAGVSHSTGPRMFSVVEDILVETAPDVTFQASLRYSAAALRIGSARRQVRAAGRPLRLPAAVRCPPDDPARRRSLPG